MSKIIIVLFFYASCMSNTSVQAFYKLQIMSKIKSSTHLTGRI